MTSVKGYGAYMFSAALIEFSNILFKDLKFTPYRFKDGTVKASKYTYINIQ